MIRTEGAGASVSEANAIGAASEATSAGFSAAGVVTIVTTMQHGGVCTGACERAGAEWPQCEEHDEAELAAGAA